MAAFTVLPDGTIARYHVGPCFDECCDKDCPEYHASIAELFPEPAVEERAL